MIWSSRSYGRRRVMSVRTTSICMKRRKNNGRMRGRSGGRNIGRGLLVARLKFVVAALDFHFTLLSRHRHCDGVQEHGRKWVGMSILISEMCYIKYERKRRFGRFPLLRMVHPLAKAEHGR